jgi:hypothetical protein
MKERKDETFDQILISNKGEPEIILIALFLIVEIKKGL